MKIVSVDKMRRLEREADAAGNTYADMMERAGRHVAAVAADLLPEGNSGPIVLLVGPGNNGGDGLVAARLLAGAGYQVRVHLARPRAESDCNWQRVREMGIPWAQGTSDEALAELDRWLRRAGLVVDALLGTGARPPVEGEVGAILRRLRASLQARTGERPSLQVPTLPSSRALLCPRLLSVDLPSGMDADTGEVDEFTPWAEVTVTFGLPKKGHFLFPGAERVGRLVVADIGLKEPPAAVGEPALLTAESVRALLPRRPAGAHKGTFGSALIVGGSSNYVGAPLLAAAGAARAGCGVVTVASIAQVLASADAVIPEATRLVLSGEVGVIGEGAVPVLREELGGYASLLVGPGLTQERPAVRFLDAFLEGSQVAAPRREIGFVGRSRPQGRGAEQHWPPSVWDADALNLVAANRDWLQRLPPNPVLTPHPGEMARLLEATVTDVQQDRLSMATRAAQEWKATVVLKGAFTVVAEPGGAVAVAPFANPALASGGTGDVLAGMVAGYLAQGLTPWEAGRAAVYVHGVAGELACRDLGHAGVLAGDLLARVPVAMEMVRGDGGLR